MGRLRALVGAAVEVDYKVYAEEGGVLVLIRNGKPFRVISPGKRFSATMRRGHIRALPVSGASVVVEHTRERVPLADEFTLPSVSLTARVSLRHTGGYRALMDRIERHGLAFVDHLDQEMTDALDAAVLETFGRLRHDELVRRTLREEFAVDRPICDGLFTLEEVGTVKPVWDPSYEQIHGLGAETAAVVADAQARVEQSSALAVADLADAEREALITKMQDALALERAQLRGISLQELENPEVVLERERMRMELLGKALENAPHLTRSPGLLDALGAMTAMQGPQHREPEMGTAAPVPPPPLSRASRMATPTSLQVDPELLAAWQLAELPRDDVYGLVCGGEPRTVLGIVADPEGARPAFAEVLQDVRPGAALLLMAYQPYLDVLLGAYVRLRLPDAPEARNASWNLIEEDGVLRARLSLREGRAAPLQRQLSDHTVRLLEPLEALLPYETIAVDLDVT
jgi:hypothetical protein